MKKCSRCKVEYALSFFNKDNKRKDGHTYHCKECVSFYSKRANRETTNLAGKLWKQKNPEKVRMDVVKRNYNLSWEEYIGLLQKQVFSCAICSTPLKAHKGIEHGVDVACVDHCHTTGEIRGLLCSTCNTALGLFKDSKALLSRANEYLGD